MATDGIIYSPVSKMDIAGLNEKALNALKYHQLLKLSSKYNIKKRWAKKDELIKCLLAVKDNLESSVEVIDNTINEDIEWTDGKDAIKDMAPPAKGQIKINRSTFTVEKNQLNDSRATYNLQQPINVFPGLKDLDPRLTFDVPKKSTKTEDTKSKIKMLTIPASRTVKRPGMNKSTRESPLKMSNRSITIKKTKDTMSPLKNARAIMSSKKLHEPIQRLSKTPVVPLRKENEPPKPSGPALNRRKSKSDDPEVRRRSGLKTHTATYRTPQATQTKNSLSKPSDVLTGVKPITATKMPNFAAIHQKQFSKMDSLDEYVNKKSERVKKLFGTPISSRPAGKEVVAAQTTKLESVKEGIDSVKVLPGKHPKTKLDDARSIFNRKGNLRTQTEVKDRNRSHIHGIRSNRRFELQMKFRNI